MGQEYILDCPFCGRPKLSVNLRRRAWHCWVCQQSVGRDAQGRAVHVTGAGGLIDLIVALEGKSWRQAADFIAAHPVITHVPLHIDRDFQKRPGIAPVELAEIPLPEGIVRIGSYGELPYLRQRGILWQDVEVFGLFWCDSGRCRNRLVFPVWDTQRFVYYQARAMWDPRPGETYLKVLNPPASIGVTADQVLFNADTALAWARSGWPLAITEGPIDCVHVGPTAVATFGKRLSEAQLGRLVRAGVQKVDVVYDADAGKQAQAVANRLAAYVPQVRVVTLPQGDPGDFNREQLWQMRHQAPNFAGGLRI